MWKSIQKHGFLLSDWTSRATAAAAAAAQACMEPLARHRTVGSELHNQRGARAARRLWQCGAVEPGNSGIVSRGTVVDVDLTTPRSPMSLLRSQINECDWEGFVTKSWLPSVLKLLNVTVGEPVMQTSVHSQFTLLPWPSSKSRAPVSAMLQMHPGVIWPWIRTTFLMNGI